MKAIVINLDSRPDRLESFRKQDFPFEVERFPGIVSASGLGQDGCALSHLAVLNAQTEFPFVVFEDDCLLIQPWRVVETAMRQLPPDWDALWLGAMVKRRLRRYSPNLFRLHSAFSLHAVIYNSKTMVDHIITKNNRRPGINLDVFYRTKAQAIFNCFIVYPIVATQRSDVSDIGGNFTNHAEDIVTYYNKYVG